MWLSNCDIQIICEYPTIQNDQSKRYLWFSRQWFISVFTSYSEELIYWQRLIQPFCTLLLSATISQRNGFFGIVFISDQFESSQFVDFCLQNKVHTSINRTWIVAQWLEMVWIYLVYIYIAYDKLLILQFLLRCVRLFSTTDTYNGREREREGVKEWAIYFSW